MKKTTYILWFFTTILACQQPHKSTKTTPYNMLITTHHDIPVEALATELISKIEAKGFKIIADINHAAAAKKVAIALRPTRTLIFGKPLGGTKLMQQNQTIGLDLPLKILIWEDSSGKTNCSYFNASTLTSRYGVSEPKTVIEAINQTLASVTDATNTTDFSKQVVANITDKLISKKSPYSVDSTFARLKTIIEAKNLSIMAEIPHDIAASSVGLKLRPTRTLVFGNPKIGSLLMQSNPEIGLDLPLKLLVHETAQGEVFISYFNASFLANRYRIKDKEAVVNKVNSALNGISNTAITTE